MARPSPIVLLFPALLVCGMVAAAQQIAPSPAPAESTPLITPGQFAVPLNGPWKFQIGDSPTDPATGKLLWAEPRFDDSKWETMDLTPLPGLSDPWSGDPRWVHGWRKKGHPDYTGWAWYRLRVRIATKPGEQMAIDGPAIFEDAWQIFANGRLLGAFGEFDRAGNVRKFSFMQPRMFLLPSGPDSADVEGFEALAFRVWMGRGELYAGGEGGLHVAPLLVASSAMDVQLRVDWEELILANADLSAGVCMFLLLAILAASLALFDRSDRVYLWVAGIMLATAVLYTGIWITTYTTWLDFRMMFVVVWGLWPPLQVGCWLMVWWIWFHLRRPAWVPGAVASLTLVYEISATTEQAFHFYGAPPHGIDVTLHSVNFGLRLAFLLLMFLVVGTGIRKQGGEGWLVLPAVLALAVSLFASETQILTPLWIPFGIAITIIDLENLLLVVALGLLMLHRLLSSLKRQRQMALDVKQAQEVQQVILPEARTSLPGLVIESEYRPAREVGGDFFQILPHEKDGSLLIIAGDVTGKGLKAGMLVALLVGAIRSTAELNDEPHFVLRALNRRLLGRSDAQATCLALRIEADGTATLVNAGHMAPYLNGESLAMEGALPLGIIEAADFSVMRFKLKEHDRLVLMSDGIAEATDANGKLFGFERIHELLRTASSAAEVASAAQKFGQEDDISVISVTRTGVPAPAFA